MTLYIYILIYNIAIMSRSPDDFRYIIMYIECRLHVSYPDLSEASIDLDGRDLDEDDVPPAQPVHGLHFQV